jgi:hypothetical protein
MVWVRTPPMTRFLQVHPTSKSLSAAGAPDSVPANSLEIPFKHGIVLQARKAESQARKADHEHDEGGLRAR